MIELIEEITELLPQLDELALVELKDWIEEIIETNGEWDKTFSPYQEDDED